MENFLEDFNFLTGRSVEYMRSIHNQHYCEQCLLTIIVVESMVKVNCAAGIELKDIYQFNSGFEVVGTY